MKMWTDMGHEVFSIGSAYGDPPFEGMRPAIDVPAHPELQAIVHESRVKHEGQSTDYPVIDWAKYDMDQRLIDWAETVIIDCFPECWIPSNWYKFRNVHVIWRTIGQSNPEVEQKMLPYRRQGLGIVRYSPKERIAFAEAFAGEDTVIRFGKDPQEWYGWTGDWGLRMFEGSPVIGDGGEPFVGNLTQHMASRPAHCGLDRWQIATEGLAACPAGPGSELLKGVGALDYPLMQGYLRGIRANLYTGTMPASYTLGLAEAMMTGTPTIAVMWQTAIPWLAHLWEADDILPRGRMDASAARINLGLLLKHPDMAAQWSGEMRERAIELFGIETISEQWAQVLGRVPVAA